MDDEFDSWISGIGVNVKDYVANLAVGKGTTAAVPTSVLNFGGADGLSVSGSVVPIDPKKAAEEIKRQLGLLKDYVGQFWDNYLLGLDDFASRMTLVTVIPESLSKLDDGISSLLQKALQTLLSEGMEALETFPPLKLAIDTVKDVATNVSAGGATQKNAIGQIAIADYLQQIRKIAANQKPAQIEAVNNATDTFVDAYNSILADGGLRPAGQGAVVGGAAATDSGNLVKQLTACVQAVQKNMPQPEYFQKEFTVVFASAKYSANNPSEISEGRLPGMLYLTVHLCAHMKDGEPVWSLDESRSSQAWRLVTKGANAAGLASNLAASSKNAWQIPMPHKVEMTVEFDEFPLNSILKGVITFQDDPTQYQTTPVSGDAKYLTMLGPAWEFVDTQKKIKAVKSVSDK